MININESTIKGDNHQTVTPLTIFIQQISENFNCVRSEL